MCHACGRPVSDEDQRSALYDFGVQCPACVDEYDESDRARFRERQKQFAIRVVMVNVLKVILVFSVFGLC